MIEGATNRYRIACSFISKFSVFSVFVLFISFPLLSARADDTCDAAAGNECDASSEIVDTVDDNPIVDATGADDEAREAIQSQDDYSGDSSDTSSSDSSSSDDSSNDGASSEDSSSEATTSEEYVEE